MPREPIRFERPLQGVRLAGTSVSRSTVAGSAAPAACTFEADPTAGAVTLGA